MNKTVIFLFVFLMLQGVSDLLDVVVKQMCKHNDYSYIVIIVSQEIWKPMETMALEYCGGSIIHVKWVLTSSNCVEKLKTTNSSSKSKLTIIAGFDSALKNFQSKLMKEYFPFKTLTFEKRAARNPRHDIALIELEQPFQQGPTLRPIKIATNGAVSKCKKAETVSPFAISELKAGSNFSRTMMKLICRDVNIGQSDFCSSIWTWITKADDTLCGEKRSDWRKKRENEQPSVCTNAVGSPLVCNDVLIGVETGCHEIEAKSAASLYVRIDYYLDFITGTLKNDSINPKGDEKNDQKTTTAKPSPSGEGFLQEAVQKTNLLLITGAVLFVYF